MAELTTIARPYAVAAFDFARKSDRLAQWSEMLHFAAEVVGQPTFAAHLDDPKLGRDKLARLLYEVGGERFDVHGRNFLRAMAEHDRLGLIPLVAKLFDRLRDEAEQRADVEVVSAYAVNATQKRTLAQALEKRLGKAVNLTTRIDKSLIGGLVIRVGDEVIDASLQGGLNQLATTLHPS
jgi:F-type H+-transporting ATPase subunit delta